MKSFWLALILLLIALDLATKYLAFIYLNEPLNVLPGIFQLHLTFNTGVAFSIPIPNWLMVALSPILIAIMVLLVAKTCDMNFWATKTGLSLLIAGGFGNFINRLWTASVIDFIDFSFWPSFNSADTYLSIAVFLFIIFYGKIIKSKYGRSK